MSIVRGAIVVFWVAVLLALYRDLPAPLGRLLLIA